MNAVGWIRGQETQRDELVRYGVKGQMIFRAECLAFGAFEYCTISLDDLRNLQEEVESGVIDAYIGGFTIIGNNGSPLPAKTTKKLMPWRKYANSERYAFRHGYWWNTTPGVGWIPLSRSECPELKKGQS